MKEIYSRIHDFIIDDDKGFMNKVYPMIEESSFENATKIILYCIINSGTAITYDCIDRFIEKFDFNCTLEEVCAVSSHRHVYALKKSMKLKLNILGFVLGKNVLSHYLLPVINKCPTDLINKIIYPKDEGMNALEYASRYYKYFSKNIHLAFIKKGAKTSRLGYFLLNNNAELVDDTIQWALNEGFITPQDKILVNNNIISLLDYALQQKNKENSVCGLFHKRYEYLLQKAIKSNNIAPPQNSWNNEGLNHGDLNHLNGRQHASSSYSYSAQLINVQSSMSPDDYSLQRFVDEEINMFKFIGGECLLKNAAGLDNTLANQFSKAKEYRGNGRQQSSQITDVQTSMSADDYSLQRFVDAEINMFKFIGGECLLKNAAELDNTLPNQYSRQHTSSSSQLTNLQTLVSAETINYGQEFAFEEMDILNTFVFDEHEISSNNFESKIEKQKPHGKSETNGITSFRKKEKKIHMFIDPKYLDFYFPDNPQNQIDTSSNKKESKHAFDQTNVTKLKFLKIENFDVGYETSITLCNERLNFIKAQEKKPISSDDKIFVVFAGRGLNASIPKDLGNARCLIVLTVNEFEKNQISQRRQLLANYDFLIIKNHRLKADGTYANSERLIERRRAALEFCNDNNLDHVVFLDDNIEEIGFVAPSGFEPKLSGLFDYVVTQMSIDQNMLVSIHTYSNLKRVPLERMLGCKVWALNLKAIRQHLPGDSMQLCFPDRESAWGEDYYLQVLLDVLSPHADGFRILDYAVVELIRHKKCTSVCKKNGMRAGLLKITDIIPEQMDVHPEIRTTIEQALAVFNNLVQMQIEYHSNVAEVIKTDDFEAKRASQYTLSSINKLTKYNEKLFHGLKFFKLNGIELKQYQRDALDFYLKNQEQKNITYNMPTGCGKTLIMLTVAFANFVRYQKNIIIIYPRIELIKQLLTEIRNTRYSTLLDYFQIRFEQIFGVSSGDMPLLENAMLSQDLIAYNQMMNDKPHILIYCEDSWSKFLEHANESNILKTIGMLIFDESHLQAKTINVSRERFNDISIHYYSATPHTPNDETFFSYSREMAIHQGYLAPMYVDSSLPDQFDDASLVKIILNQEHPNNGKLSQHKGIVYVDNIQQALILATKLNDSLGAENVFEIHSKCIDCSGNIQKFRDKKRGAVAIAVDMLQEGYNDEALNFVIYAKSSQVTDSLRQNLIQAAGRMHRLCADNPNKVGFLITRNRYAGIVNTCLTSDVKIIPSVRNLLFITNKKERLVSTSLCSLEKAIDENLDKSSPNLEWPKWERLSFLTDVSYKKRNQEHHPMEYSNQHPKKKIMLQRPPVI